MTCPLLSVGANLRDDITFGSQRAVIAAIAVLTNVFVVRVHRAPM